jgi:hypothetical protein
VNGLVESLHSQSSRRLDRSIGEWTIIDQLLGGRSTQLTYVLATHIYPTLLHSLSSSYPKKNPPLNLHSFPNCHSSVQQRPTLATSKRPQEPDSDEMNDSEQEYVNDSEEECPEASNLLSEDIKSQLLHSLEHLSSAMSFASSGSCPIAENPGIWIRGIGGIGLPLSERDAELISKVTHPAPYGKGPDTIVDPTFRKTQELNTGEFELRNPKWNTALESVVRRAAIELGVPGEPSGVKAVLYKMLIYGEAAMFKEHRESVSHCIITNIWILADKLSRIKFSKTPRNVRHSRDLPAI